jgi:hypothetical protein
MERIDGPIGAHADDLRAVMGPAAIINTMRRMFSEGSDMLDMRQLIPWYKPEPEKLMYSPDDPDYDSEAHADALRALLMRHVTQKEDTVH